MIVATAVGIVGTSQSNWAADTGIHNTLHLKCVEASQRAKADAAAMVPGRT
jgi:hypothetical protein